MSGVQCGVTVFETSFPYIYGTPVMRYGGELICATTVAGGKSLEIEAQVAGPGPRRFNYYTITGSTLSTGPSATPYLTLSTGRTVYIGHPYRIVAIGTVTYGGRTTAATAHSVTAGP
jgi:hypothetical protein